MDRLVRARILMAEAASLSITLDDLTAIASDSPQAVTLIELTIADGRITDTRPHDVRGARGRRRG